MIGGVLFALVLAVGFLGVAAYYHAARLARLEDRVFPQKPEGE